MSQGLSVPICTDGVELGGSNPESLCSQETVRFGVKARAGLCPQSALFVVLCGFGLHPSALRPSLASSLKTAEIPLPCCVRRNHVARFKNV